MKVSNLLPPADQRAKLFSPFDVAGKVAEKIQQTEQSAPIEAKVTQFVKKSETVRLPRFENENEVEQFREDHFLKFGEHLLYGVAKHMGVEISDQDKAGMTTGFDIELDHGLYTKESREG